MAFLLIVFLLGVAISSPKLYDLFSQRFLDDTEHSIRSFQASLDKLKVTAHFSNSSILAKSPNLSFNGNKLSTDANLKKVQSKITKNHNRAAYNRMDSRRRSNQELAERRRLVFLVLLVAVSLSIILSLLPGLTAMLYFAALFGLLLIAYTAALYYVSNVEAEKRIKLRYMPNTQIQSPQPRTSGVVVIGKYRSNLF